MSIVKVSLVFTTLLILANCSPKSKNLTSAKNAISEESFIKIGGIEQWVTIHGDNTSLPVLVVVHGGPGDVQSCFKNEYSAYEKNFILVQWDQRGTGKTYGKYKEDTPNLTLPQLVEDGLELSEYLAKKFKRKVIVMGHSFGSVIATMMVEKKPELFSAYVGTGQVASWSECVHWQFNFLKKKAILINDTALANKLNKIGTPDPANTDQFFGFNRPIRKFLPKADSTWLADTKKTYDTLPKKDVENIINGFNLSGNAMLPFQVKENLSQEFLTFKVPYLIVQGKDDLFTPAEPVENYFKKISAPHKKLVIIENAGHFALTTHIQDFVPAIEKLLQENK